MIDNGPVRVRIMVPDWLFAWLHDYVSECVRLGLEPSIETVEALVRITATSEVLK